jgi:hypothetical protein
MNINTKVRIHNLHILEMCKGREIAILVILTEG